MFRQYKIRMLYTPTQQRFSLNVKAGPVNGMLIEPFFFSPRMSVENYLDFLQNNLSELVDVPLRVRQIIWYLQDGALL